MIAVRKSKERGHANHGWLNSFHTFSFADYHDPEHMGFRSLRVINDDRVAAGRGFGAHAHRDMEILSYVLEGRLAHRDSMGHTEVLGPNEIQKMSAGSGVVHSEFNGSETELVHFLQIWIEPSSRGNPPSYEQVQFNPAEKLNTFRLLASPVSTEGAVQINQDAKVHVSELTADETLSYALASNRFAWVHVIDGEVELNGLVLGEGDSASLSDEETVHLKGLRENSSNLLLFDLA